MARVLRIPKNSPIPLPADTRPPPTTPDYFPGHAALGGVCLACAALRTGLTGLTRPQHFEGRPQVTPVPVNSSTFPTVSIWAVSHKAGAPDLRPVVIAIMEFIQVVLSPVVVSGGIIRKHLFGV